MGSRITNNKHEKTIVFFSTIRCARPNGDWRWLAHLFIYKSINEANVLFCLHEIIMHN